MRLPATLITYLHDRGNHRFCPSTVIQWEGYAVPGGWEAQGMPEDGSPDEWVHADSPAALVAEVFDRWPDRQHSLLLGGHGWDRHLCPSHN